MNLLDQDQDGAGDRAITTHVHELAKLFDDAWQSALRGGDRPRIEDYLANTPEIDRPALFRELLAAELECRRRRREQPTVEEYADRFPLFREELPALINAAAASRHQFPLRLDCPHCGSPIQIQRTASNDAITCPSCGKLHDIEAQPDRGSTAPAAPPSPDTESNLVENVPPGAAAVPESIGRYAVRQRLGGGTYGDVYLGYDTLLQREVAIKLPSARWLKSQDARDEFLREARAVARLQHENIVRAYDMGQVSDGSCYIVYELVDGVTLARRIDRACIAHEPLSPAESARIVACVARGLHHAHLHGLVHRDVKPSNILLDRSGSPRVTDFGLAVHDEELSGQRGNLAGTLPYMSPEQVRRAGHHLDGRSDIYSLGVVLYELLCGRRPFEGKTSEELIEQILTREAKPPRQIRDTIPRELEAICLKALSKRVSDRHTTAADMADELTQFSSLAAAPVAKAARLTTAPTATGAERLVYAVFHFADSEALNKLGRVGYERLISRQQELLRQILASHSGAAIIRATDDRSIVGFANAVHAVALALEFQNALHTRLPSVSARSGIHGVRSSNSSGWVFDFNETRSGTTELASKLAKLALRGQILLTRDVFDQARFIHQEHPSGPTAPTLLQWMAHGTYVPKGSDEPIEVFEVGMLGQAPLREPPDNEQMRRYMAPGDEVIVGSFGGPHPARGSPVAGRENWILEQTLGEGGFGEVWLGRHKVTRENRVFKFCLQVDRLRTLKREVILFRLLKESLGNRNDIARIIDWQFDKPPYFLESEYTPSGSLPDWVNSLGGMHALPMERRLKVVEQTAQALAAAHGAGVLHKDIKPTNILIRTDEENQPHAILADFGIGLITDRELLLQKGISVSGLSQTVLGTKKAWESGTRLYMAPEWLEGKPPTALADIYALGVVLYQLVVGDFRRALASGWERDVADDVIREDIARCVDGRPQNRYQAAADLADSLCRVETRRAERAKRQAELEKNQLDSERRKRFRLTREAEKQRSRADRYRYVHDINLAERAWKERNLLRMLELLVTHRPVRDGGADRRGFEWHYLWRLCHSCQLTLRGPSAAALNATFSPDGKHLLATFQDGIIRMWDSAIGQEVMTFRGHADSVTSANFSPNAKQIASSAADGAVKVWDVASGKEILNLVGHAGIVWNVQYSHDGKRLASAGHNGFIRIWNASSGDPLLTTQASEQAIWTLAFSPDDKLLACGGMEITFKLLNVETGDPLMSLEGHEGAIWSLCFTPDGNHVISASEDATIRIWDIQLGSGSPKMPPMPTFYDKKYADANNKAIKEMQQLALKGEAKALYEYPATASPKVQEYKEQLIEAYTSRRITGTTNVGNEQRCLTGHGDPVSAVAVSRDGNRIASGSGDKTVRIWDFENQQKTLLFKDHSDAVLSTAFSPDSKRVVSCSADGIIKVWDVTGGQEVLRKHTDVVWSVAFSPDAQTLASCSSDGLIILWDVQSCQAIRKLNLPRAWHKGHPPRCVQSVSYSPDSKYLASGSHDHSVKIWDTTNGEEVRHLQGHKAGVDHISFSHDGRRLASLGHDGTLIVWDTIDGKALFKHASEGQISCGTFSTDRNLFVGTRAGEVKMLHATTGEELSVLCEDLSRGGEGHLDAVKTVSCSRDGRFLVSVGAERLAIVWDLRKRKALLRLKGHTCSVTAACIAPDGERIATADWEGTVKIWDRETGQEMIALSGHSQSINGVAFSPEGGLLATASSDTTVIIWNGRPLPSKNRPLG